MNVFAQLAKYDETTGYFEAVAASEAVDRSGEVFDFVKSKPHFIKWSETVSKASGGKSLGNVREMHGKVAAGKLTSMVCDDDSKSIKVAGFAIDPVTKTKLSSGVLTGVSIGGSYVSKWEDPVLKGVTRYEAAPTEISLVDFPCNPDAHFTLVKDGGVEELSKFAVSTTDAEAFAKWYAGQTDEVRDALAKVAERKDVNPKEGENKYGDVEFADAKNKKYPINTPAHIRAAWNYINKPKNAAKYDSKDLKTIKSRIIAAWKDKIDKNGPPSAEAQKGDALADSRAAGLMAKIDHAEPLLRTVRAAYGMEPLAKDLYGVGCLAELVSRLDCITVSAEFEADWEGDNSAVPAELRSVVKELAGILIDMADEEVEELVSAYEKADLDGDLHKVAPTVGDDVMSNDLQKSLDDTKAELTKATTDLTAANESLAKVTGERDDLTKAVKERDDMLVKAAAHIESQAALIEKMKDQPEALKIALSSFGKGEDTVQNNQEDKDKVLKADGTVDEAATAIRKALRNPVVTR